MSKIDLAFILRDCGGDVEKAQRRIDLHSESNRILELELEVKRLHNSLETTIIYGLARACNMPGCKVHGQGPDYCTWHQHFNDARTVTLSTPPPALAEAYVRLRDAAHTVTHYESSNKMAAALAEIERLEKGE